jgi:hypothetical protein
MTCCERDGRCLGRKVYARVCQGERDGFVCAPSLEYAPTPECFDAYGSEQFVPQHRRCVCKRKEDILTTSTTARPTTTKPTTTTTKPTTTTTTKPTTTRSTTTTTTKPTTTTTTKQRVCYSNSECDDGNRCTLDSCGYDHKCVYTRNPTCGGNY